MDAVPILQLPLELLQLIVQRVPIATRLSLCLVSKSFHSFTIPSVYRDISLKSPSSVVRCCHTLSNSKFAATFIKRFAITLPTTDPSDSTFLASYYNIIRKALQNATTIQDLVLMVYDPNLAHILDACTFPSLRQFHCQMTLTHTLVAFLNRHPKILYLQLSPDDHLSDSEFEATPQVRLPKLQYFAGNGESFSSLAFQTCLRAAFVSWDAVDEEPQNAITILEQCRDLHVLSCRRRGWNLDLLDLVSSRLPRLSALIINNVLIVDTQPSEFVIHTITSYLSRFTELERLVIHCIDMWQMGSVTCDMDDDFKVVTSFGGACPSLVEITLPHSNGLPWQRIVDNVWIPDPKISLGADWIHQRVSSGQYPGWEKVMTKLMDIIKNDPRLSEGFSLLGEDSSFDSDSEGWVTEEDSDSDVPATDLDSE